MKRSLVIILIVILSVLTGFIFDRAATVMEMRSYPLKYSEYVDIYATEYNVPKEIVYSVIRTESSFISDAVSSKGAIGLMQITPDTFDWLNFKFNAAEQQGMLYNPEVNIKYGTYLLSLLYLEYQNWDITFAAYNAGRGRVNSEWLNDEQYIKDGKIIKLPIEETDRYVKKVNEGRELYKRLYFK